MLLPFLFAASHALPADTVPLHGVVLLGEPIAVSTFTRAEPPVVTRMPFGFHASLPLPPTDFPGMPMHLVDAPMELGFAAGELERAIRTVEEETYRGGFPGAALAIGRWDRTVVERGIGAVDRSLGSPRVDPDHSIYDLASLTKVVATTTAVMLLVEDGVLDLDTPVSRHLPGFTGGGREKVTFRHLLLHTSGLPAGANLAGATPTESMARAIAVPLVTEPGRRVVYSDIGFIILWAAAEAAYGAPMEELLERRVFEPLEMRTTRFAPGHGCLRCAPTDAREGYRGVVHDPLARRLGGVAGHAGLFSTAHDISRFAAMMANGGVLDGVRVLNASTIALFTRRQPGAGTRTLGWDTPNPQGTGAGGLRISRSAFGHTGFTGTSLWIDPERGAWVVLLANRTYRPSGPNRMQALRRELNDLTASALEMR